VAIYTAGFAEWTAEQFFGELKQRQVEQLIDVRLNNVSQLAGFAKKKDLEYFLRTICGADYRHEPMLAPTADMLKDYRSKKTSWLEYERLFMILLAERRVESVLSRQIFDGNPVFLCSEHKPDHCHRRLALEYLQMHWGIESSLIHIV
jgi:uncharacterized protein (DUF488 family)